MGPKGDGGPSKGSYSFPAAKQTGHSRAPTGGRGGGRSGGRKGRGRGAGASTSSQDGAGPSTSCPQQFYYFLSSRDAWNTCFSPMFHPDTFHPDMFHSDIFHPDIYHLDIFYPYISLVLSSRARVGILWRRGGRSYITHELMKQKTTFTICV